MGSHRKAGTLVIVKVLRAFAALNFICVHVYEQSEQYGMKQAVARFHA